MVEKKQYMDAPPNHIVPAVRAVVLIISVLVGSVGPSIKIRKALAIRLGLLLFEGASTPLFSFFYRDLHMLYRLMAEIYQKSPLAPPPPDEPPPPPQLSPSPQLSPPVKLPPPYQSPPMASPGKKPIKIMISVYTKFLLDIHEV